ncbi:putative disease resistance protein [Carex littledalei]|uniref:Putative disease resistance protein n=1 Tax=Carex littledalei TaxID=544730 RepID=A0A833R889_9POAL|nr:putative disease resistance protein [Carex littledalei]
MPFPNISSVILKLGGLLVQEGIYLYGTDDKIKWVNTELTRIQFFLGDAELKWKNRDAAVMNWVKEITDVGYEIEDLIDLLKYRNEIRRRRKGFIGSISRYAHLPGEIIALHKVGAKVDKIKAKLEDISKSKDRYGIISTGNQGNEESGGGGDDMIYIERFHSPHFVDDVDVVGFDSYMNKLIGRILNQGNLVRSVVSIVGMGGLGKTTLARKVFGCPQVKEKFLTFAWIAVSQKNTLINLLKEIAKQVMDIGKGGLRRSEGESSSSLSIKMMNEMGELELKREIFEFLQGRKYLVVLDDVWSIDHWEMICHIFPDNSNGSKILLTTRNMEVAEHADPRSIPLELQVLGDVESWEVLRRKIFPRNHEVKRSLVQVAKRSKNGERVTKIRIHDVLRDWCIKEARKSGFFNINNIEKKSMVSATTSNDNRVAIHNKSLDGLLVSSLGDPRTILTFGTNLNGNYGKGFDRFNLLRVLDIQGSSGIRYVPEKIGELIHLRYLGVRNTEVAKIPSSIGQLLYLETFDARGTQITKVPISFWKIQSLMYVYLPCFLEEVPRNDITQNLHKLYMGFTLVYQRIKWMMLYELLQQQKNLVSLTIDLKGLPHKDELEFYNQVGTVSNNRIPIDSLFASKKELQFLKLYGVIGRLSIEEEYFPHNLIELTLKMSNILCDPMPVLGKLSCLTLLRLGIGSYRGTHLNCNGGDFPRLRHLSLEWRFIQEGWNVQHGSMPVLATLHINGCFYMHKIPIGLQHLVALKELRLSDIPLKIEKRTVKDEGEDWPIIRHIPSIILRRAW